MSRDYADWIGHIIVCGLDGVGLRTVEQLHHAGVRVVVVEDGADLRLLRIVRSWGIPHLVGSSRLAETLTEAGLPGASAVICVLADDLHTLETALLVRQQRPEVRIVVQLRNPAVGRALSRIAVSVLDVAGLSAPSVVEACLRTGAHELELGGERFVAAQVVADWSGTLRSSYGDLAPVAVIPANGEPTVLCPGRDHKVRPGDLVTLLGTAEQLHAAGLSWGEAQTTEGVPRKGILHRAARLLDSILDVVDRRMVLALGALLALVMVAVTVLRLGYREPGGTRMTVLDAVYFTVETIGTVGYGDFSFRQQPTWLRFFAISLMVLGAMLATVFFALLTNTLVSLRIEETLGRGRLNRLSGHVVVVGVGSIGVRVVERLVATGSEVVVVDSNENNRYLAQVRAAGVPVVIADATLPRTLLTVQLGAARAVAVLTSDDLVNLETGLAVRDQLGADPDQIPVVLRLFDRQLASTVERSFGFGLVRSTAALAAPWFVGAALGLDILATFYVGQQLMLVGRLTVATAGGLDGLAMQDLSARTRVVAISRAARNGKLEHPPRRDTRFSAGDQAYLIGPYEELLQVLRRDSLSPAQALESGSPDRPAASNSGSDEALKR
jgi:Trk K+ transport system NAD-binding subunit